MAAMLGKIGRTTEGLRVVDEGLHAAERGGAHWYDAELYRVRAELRHTSDAGRGLEAEKDLKKAIETARAQDARHFELRAATDLSRYWAEQGQSKLAHDLLAPVLDWFTEGLDTPDVVAARTHLSRMVA
jgi:predicted ATPase